jgi:hypothetical protein
VFGFSISGKLTAIAVRDAGPVAAHPDPLTVGKILDAAERDDQDEVFRLLNPRHEAMELIPGLSYRALGPTT